MSKLGEVVEFFGSKSKLAGALGVGKSAVSHWIKADALPPERAIQIEVMSGGRFKAADFVAKEKRL